MLNQIKKDTHAELEEGLLEKEKTRWGRVGEQGT